MNLAEGLSTYASLNILVALGFLILRGTWIFLERVKPSFQFRSQLKLHYFILSAIFVLTLASPLFPRADFFEPAAKVWSAGSIKSFSDSTPLDQNGGYLNIPTGDGPLSVEANQISFILLIGFISVLLLATLQIILDLFSLYRIKSKSYLVRKLGRVYVFLNDEIKVPFSYWLPGRANVVVPSSLLTNPIDYQIAIHHELQHHRQKDTCWVYLIWILRSLCILNPFAHLWSRWISEIQEFACDETLVAREKVSPQQYVRCLIEVANNAFNQKRIPACATGLTFLVERNLLTRRVEKMISTNKYIENRWSSILHCAVASITLVSMIGATYAAKGIVQDRRVSQTEAEAMLKNLKPNLQFSVVINDLVLQQLNRYIGTPEGREHMKSSLERMKAHRELIEKKLNEYDVPKELLAIPVIESGYQNLEPNNKKHWGAGIWMFITSTAKHFGLHVDKNKDERLNVDLETDAAMRLLKANHLRFKDWHLSVLAYNMGETAVQKAIERTKSRDSWTIIRKGFEKDPEYLAQLMAAILIMENPKTLD